MLDSERASLRLACTMIRGVGSAGVHWLMSAGLAELGVEAIGQLNQRSVQANIARALRQRGLVNRALDLAWPATDEVQALARRLDTAQVALVVRGEQDYPARLGAVFGCHAPAWVWLAGARDPLRIPAVSVVGSRQTAPALQEAAFRLGRALAVAGLAVASGQAAGADRAAESGALAAGESGAGVVVFPACGVLRARVPRACGGGLALVGAAAPHGGFSAHTALARNDLIAAWGEGLVLVSSGLAGGSSYAVDWARRHRRPIFCFECGPDTPPANRQLLRAGLAAALPVKAGPSAWVRAIRQALASAADSRDPCCQQTEFLASI